MLEAGRENQVASEIVLISQQWPHKVKPESWDQESKWDLRLSRHLLGHWLLTVVGSQTFSRAGEKGQMQVPLERN